MFGKDESKAGVAVIFWLYFTERATVLQNAFGFWSVSLALKERDAYIFKSI